MRYNPQQTYKRNCGLCWKAVDPKAKGTVSVRATGGTFVNHYHETCYQTVLVERATLDTGNAVYQCADCKLDMHEYHRAVTGKGTCQCPKCI